MSGRKVSKADLLELAQVLGDDLAGTDELAGESMVTIFFRCLDRARELAAKTPALPPLALVEDRTVEQLFADGDDLRPELTPEEREATEAPSLELPPVVDRRLNAEQWAKTRGSKGADRTA